MRENNVLRPRMRRPGTHPLVRIENLLHRDRFCTESNRVGLVVRVRRQGVCDPLRDFDFDSCLAPLELREGTRRHAAQLGELRLRQSCQDTQVAEESFVFRNGHQFGYGDAERSGDPGEGVDARRRITAFPAVDSAGTHVCDTSQLCRAQTDAVPGGDEGGAVESAQDSSAHTWLSSLVTPCHFAGTPTVLSQDEVMT